MKSYLKFLFLSMFSKISTWVIAFIYVFSIISFVYIIPAVLHWSLSKTFAYVSLILLIIIIIAAASSFITATIFRTGIDDGTELLILSKEIGRANIILAKIIVLITFQFSLSFICGLLAVFSKYFAYGSSNPLPYVVGIFLLYIIVGLFFSSITILFSLKLKKSSLTILSTAISVLLSILCFINYVVAKTPGVYNQIESYSISQNSLFKKTDNKNMEIQDGYNLYFNHFPVTSASTNYDGEYIINDKNSNNVIQYIYSSNLNKSGFKISSQFDLGFQWTQLMNLSNFIHNSETTEPTSRSPSSLFESSVMSNYYLSFNQIDVNTNNSKYVTFNLGDDLDIVPISTRENFIINNKFNNSIFPIYLEPIDNKYYNLSTQKIYLPILIDDKIKLMQFDNPYQNKSADIITYLVNELKIIDMDKVKEWNIIDMYKEFNKYIGEDIYFSQFLMTFFFNNYCGLINQISKNENIEIIDQKNNVIQTVDNDKVKNLMQYDFHINLNFNQASLNDYFNSVYLNSTNSIVTFVCQALESVQLSIVEYLQNISNKDDELNSIVITGIFKNESEKNNFTYFYPYNKYLNNINKDDILANKILINNIPVSTTNYENFSTFATAKFNTYLNIYGTVFGWLSICIIFISVATYFYYKKDFK